MAQDVDLNKVVRQHLEMESFFTGFAVKGKPFAASGSTSNREVAESDAEEPSVVSESPAPGEPLPAENLGRQKQESIRTVSVDAVKELEAIAAEVRQCRKCDLGGLRTNAVPGEGNPRTRIMFVGEAPGADEDAQGRPFVGRAGQLLDKIIEACGLKREDVFIANILKCRPPENREPRPDEIVDCLPYLQRQIEILNPEVIVALGGHAAKTLLNTVKGISQLRGQFHEYNAGIGRPPTKLMATFHPAYLLRNYTPETRRRVWEDMKKVLVELGLPVPERGKSA
jgi:DNA polymerase